MICIDCGAPVPVTLDAAMCDECARVAVVVCGTVAARVTQLEAVTA